MWKVLLLILVVLLLVNSREHMTNADLISTLKTFGTDGKVTAPKDYASEAPIWGPKAPQVVPAPPKSGGGDSRSGVYPEIFGPEYQGPPGAKKSSKKTKNNEQGSDLHQSDDTSDPTYEFNPDLKKAFPTNGPPQPFLTDFSKFQK
jgi:hypothetical protein